MNLTILGNNGPFPGAGGACSGYLLCEGSTKILIDCGNGVLSNLQRFAGFDDLDAIILTHLHSDHMADMMVLRYAIQIKTARKVMEKPVNVFAPSEPQMEYGFLSSLKGIYNTLPIEVDTVLRFGSLKVTFAQMKHPVKCFAVSVENGTKRFVFSGDTSWNENIIAFARNADLLMLDAGLLSKDKTDENVPHLTAEECGIVAAKSGAKRLLLTHFWPEYDLKELIGEAKRNYENVLPAVLLSTYEI